MRIAFLPAVAAMALFMPSTAIGQRATPLFSSDAPLNLVITAPISNLMRNRAQPGTVSGTLADASGTLPISLSLRGITRRTSEVCDFAPLRVDFASPPPANSVFSGQRRLKLVTHCGAGPGAQQYELLEYAAYRMYNQLTPRSFRVRLASIDYRDANGRPMITRYGFFIEDLKDVARRNGMNPSRAPNRIGLSLLNPMDSARYALFQHMIANHDWSMRAGPAGKACCHNAELIGALTPGGVTPIPYDFDYSGMVGAPYAVPPAEMTLSTVKQRFFRGYCAHSSQIMAAAQQFRAARAQIVGVLAQTPGLEPRTQSRAAGFLNGFFNDIATDRDVSAKVLKRCAA